MSKRLVGNWQVKQSSQLWKRCIVYAPRKRIRSYLQKSCLLLTEGLNSIVDLQYQDVFEDP